MLSCEFCKISKDTICIEYLWATASEVLKVANYQTSVVELRMAEVSKALGTTEKLQKLLVFLTISGNRQFSFLLSPQANTLL